MKFVTSCSARPFMLPFLSLPRVQPFLLAAVVAAAVGMPSAAQQSATAGVPDVQLEAHDGKSTFYLGEPIRLDLVFANRTGSPFMLNNTVYGDLSEHVEIAPGTGWFQWQTPSGHDYSSEAKLDDAPIQIPVRLDEGFVFREPGEYRVRVTTARLMRGNTLGGVGVPAITTNVLTIKIQPMPAEVEEAKMREIRADLARAGSTNRYDSTRTQGMRNLATLQGEDALAEKVKLLEEGDDDFRSVSREAFATTHDLQKQLVLLEQAWTDPKLTPQYDTPDALDETRLLLAGRSLRGWQMVVGPNAPDAVEERLATERRADMVALLDSMPQRTGESRTMGAYFLIEFGGLTEAQRARAVDYVVEEFPHMDDTAQHMLLETSRPPLHDPRLVPVLRSLLAANPSDKDATAALLAMAPAESAAWIVKSVCTPKGVVLLDTFKDASVDRVPEVDTCLAPLLRVAPSSPREEFDWKQRAEEAARFATPAILPALREGWKSSKEDGAALAVLMRDDPTGAIELLADEVATGKLDGMLFFETGHVYGQIHQPYPDKVLMWLRTKLESGTDKEASTAAYALSIGGDASDGTRVEQRLERLRAEWQDHEQTEDARKAEIELASALGSYGSKTFIDEAQRHQLGERCMSDQCRLYLH
jgi:hypothetical protein